MKNHIFAFLTAFLVFTKYLLHAMIKTKITFTCDFGAFAFRRMPFGLCSAPATFQRCMLSIFPYFVGKCIEVFMDDFTSYGDDFGTSLNSLELILK